VTLSNEVECDETYVVAGHKGQPEVVKNKGRKGRRNRLKAKRGRGTLHKERPPVFGMMQRGGQVVINMLANVKQKTIESFIKDTITPGTLVYTDEYSIYARLCAWGYHRCPLKPRSPEIVLLGGLTLRLLHALLACWTDTGSLRYEETARRERP
jgi:transposase-like protein